MLEVAYTMFGGLIGWAVGYTAGANGWSDNKLMLSLLPFALGATLGFLLADF